MELEVGKTYAVVHDRKGAFVLRVTDVCDLWVDGDVVSGTTQTLLPENMRGVGEHVCLRKDFVKITEEL